MAKKIKSEDIVEKDVFSDTRGSAESLLKVLKDVQNELKNIAGTLKKEIAINKFANFEDVKAFNSSLEKSKVVINELNKVEKEQATLKQKIVDATKKEAVETQKLKVQLQEQNKLNKEIAKDQLGLAGAYDKQSKKLIELRKQYKDLTLSGKENSDAARGIKEEIDKLDSSLKTVDASVGQFQRNVGNYSGALAEAANSTGLFGTALNTLKEIGDGFGKVFGFVSKELKEVFSAQRLVTKATEAQTIAQRASNLAAESGTRILKLFNTILKTGFIAVIGVAVASITAFFKRTEEGGDSLEKLILQIEAVAGVIVNRLGKAGAGLINVFSGIVNGVQLATKNIKLFFLEASSGLSKLFGGEGKDNELQKLREEIELLSKENDFKKGINDIKEAFTGLGGAISEAAKQAAILADRIDKLEEKTIRTKFAIQNLSKSEEKYTDIINDGTLSFNAREEAEAKLRDVSKSRLDLQLRLSREEFELAKLRLGISTETTDKEIENALRTGKASGTLTTQKLKDLLELREKTIQIQNEIDQKERDIEQAKRERLIKQTKNDIRIIEEFGDKQQDEIIKAAADTAKSLEERLALISQFAGSSEKEFSDAILKIEGAIDDFNNNGKKIDVEKLLGAKSSVELEAFVRDLNLSDKIEDELIKLITNIKDARLKAAEESNKAVNDTFEAAIKQLDAEQKAISDRLAAEAAAKKAARIKLLQEEIAFAKSLTDKTFDEINRRKQAEIKAQDDIINKRKESVDRQFELAKNGQANTLAFEQEQLRKAEVEKRRLAQEQEKREKRQVFFKALIANLDASKSPSDTASAIGKSIAVAALADVIAGFFATGVENFKGKGTGTSDSNIVAISSGESVLTAKGTSKYKGLATAINNLEAEKWFMKNAAVVTTDNTDTSALIVASGMERLIRTVKDKETININWESHDTRVERIIKDGHKRTIKYINSKKKI